MQINANYANYKIISILLVITILVGVLIIPTNGLFKQLNILGGKSLNSWHKNPEYKNNGDAENIIYYGKPVNEY